jgi:hypothetical protein
MPANFANEVDLSLRPYLAGRGLEDGDTVGDGDGRANRTRVHLALGQLPHVPKCSNRNRPNPQLPCQNSSTGDMPDQRSEGRRRAVISCRRRAGSPSTYARQSRSPTE